jgi:hypothetical protein
MADRPIGDSAQDFGNTIQYTGAVGLTAVLVPSSPGDDIVLALIRCPTQTPITKILYWSLDDITYHALSPGEFIGWPMKGSKKQIYVKGSVASVNYEILINTEDT